MQGEYRILCDSGRHVHVLDRAEMVKVFGEQKVADFESGNLRFTPRAPSCLECDEDDERAAAERDIHELGLEMSAADGYYSD